MFKVNNKDIRKTPGFSVSIVNFEHIIVGWVSSKFQIFQRSFYIKNHRRQLLDLANTFSGAIELLLSILRELLVYRKFF